MTFPLPQCTSCVRRTLNESLRQWQPARQQIRGKKKTANATTGTITVRLRKDLPLFGRKGSLVPVSVGQMRNRFYPQAIAEYVNAPEMKTLRLRNVSIERDFEFGMSELAKQKKSKGDAVPQLEGAETPVVSTRATPRSQQAVRVEQVTPERSIELLRILIPTRLDFYRQALESTSTATTAQSKTGPNARRRTDSASGAAADLLAARKSDMQAQAERAAAANRAIFGSVSTADVATAMRAVMARNDEAARVLFGEEDIRFLNVKAGDQVLQETDRVKNVGEYQVRVGVKGTEETLTRNVRVIAQDS